MNENLSPAMRTALDATVSKMLAYGKAPHATELRVYGAGRTNAALLRRGLVDMDGMITPEGCDAVDGTQVSGYMVKYGVDGVTAREQVACPDTDGTPISAGATVEFCDAPGFRKAAKVVSFEPGAPGAPARVTVDMIEVDDPETKTIITRGRPYTTLANRFRVRPAAVPAPGAVVDVDGAPLEERAVVELVYGDGSPSQLGSLALVVALGPDGSTEGPLVTLTDVAWGGRYTRLASRVRRVAMFTLWEDADGQVGRSRETYAVKGAPGAYRLVVSGSDAELRREAGDPGAPGEIDPEHVTARIFTTVDGMIITTGHRFGPRRMVAAGDGLFMEKVR